MYPSVERYYAALDAAEKHFTERRESKLSATHAAEREATTGDARNETWAKFYAAERELRDEYNSTMQKALEVFREEITREDDPMAVWLVTSEDSPLEEYPSYAKEVLTRLPLSVAELKGFARNSQWCNEFDRYLRKAQRAVAIPAPSAREQLEDWFTTQLYGRNSSYFRQLSELLDKVVAEAKTAE